MKDEPLVTFRQTLADLGWFSVLFSALVGGPSMLALLQMILVEHRLIDSLQWIVDGYNDITAVLGAFVEPLVLPVVAWLNALYDWNLELRPHWRPMFILVCVFVVPLFRVFMWSRRKDRPGSLVPALALSLLGALVGGVATGLAPLDGGAWPQAAMASVPLASAVFAAWLLFPIEGRLVERLAVAILTSLLIAALPFGVGLSTGPQVQTGILPQGAGIFVSAAYVAFWGGFFVFTGMLLRDVAMLRGGLMALGGFIASGAILAADAGVKALS